MEHTVQHYTRLPCEGKVQSKAIQLETKLQISSGTLKNDRFLRNTPYPLPGY